MVSSVLRNELQINALISRCKETWAGGHVGGRAWLGTRGQLWTFKELWGAGAGWAFRGGAQPGGRGFVCACVSPPPRRIVRRPPKARI
jgi:hypothetical protein